MPKSKAERQGFLEIVHDVMAKSAMGTAARSSMRQMLESNRMKLNFENFLVLVQSLREMQRGEMKRELKRLFDFYDKDGSGDLRMGEIATILEDLGLNPKSGNEQKLIASILEEVDERGTEPMRLDLELNISQILMF